VSESPASSANRARLNLETLEARENPTVHYFGGALLRHVEVQGVYYGSGWQNNIATANALEGYLRTLVTGPYMDALTHGGYGVGRGSATTGVIDNISLTDGSTITDASIQAELTAQISKGSSSFFAPPDANRLYVVFVQPNVAVNIHGDTSQTEFEGYHSAFVSPFGTIIPYAVIAYPGGTVGNATNQFAPVAFDQLTDVTSHEVAEAVTNPQENVGKLAWYDNNLRETNTRLRGEIADITAFDPNAHVRLNGYLVQEVATKRDAILPVDLGSVPNSIATTTTLAHTTTPIYLDGLLYAQRVTITVEVRATSARARPTGALVLFVDGRAVQTKSPRLVNGHMIARFTYDMYYRYPNATFSVRYIGHDLFAGSDSPGFAVNF
jgi:hypothetical protein